MKICNDVNYGKVLNFGAGVNLKTIKCKLKEPEKIEKMFFSATKDYPNDKLELKLGCDGWLNIMAVDELNNNRAFDLTIDETDKLFECSQESIAEKLILAFNTLKTGIKRDIDLQKEIGEEFSKDNRKTTFYSKINLYSETENYKTSKIMYDMLEKDDILSGALFSTKIINLPD